MGPDPAVATVRTAVRRALGEYDPAAGRVIVACSGGADSVALAAALAFEAPRSGHRAGAVTVDHGLQEGSAERAGEVVLLLRDLGLDPAEAVPVKVDDRGGLEAAAREARYAGLREAAVRLGAAAVLLGHTRDDQAETVLLGLARGSGARSLAGMPPAFDRGGVWFARPLLDLDRATTRRACAALGLPVWDDPHNADPAFTRVRVRRDALPALEGALGPGVAAALARTARMLRADADALDAWADRAWHAAARAAGDAAAPSGPRGADQGAPDRGALDRGALDIAMLAELPRAVRTRVLRRAAIAAGSPPGTLAAVHIDEVDRLITAWHGQRHVDLPGGVRAARRYGKLLLFGFGEPT
ncbi:MAG TPA: tRNA lysidine(34) synthetase TilS [Streptosporangiaceae bacterium]|nr:tRNA lysidine(34) synthetase TilS [Streptosporangiaceae bacterium]